MKIAARAKRIAPSLTLELTAKAKRLKAEGRDVVSFGAGEPDFNTPEYICNAAKQAIDDGVTKYTPASGTPAIKQAIVDKFNRENGLDYTVANIVVSNGAKHSLHNAINAIIEDGDEVIIPSPYWLTYPELVTLAGGKPVFVETKPENGFKMTADELSAAITERTAAVILNNPNNPTGAVYSRAEIEALAAVLENTEIAVISDEIYEVLNYTDEPVYSIAKCSESMKSRTIIINGVSKTYAMTGWRIGFIAAPIEVAKAISNMQSHTTSNPNSIAQAATVAAYESEEGGAFLCEMKESFIRRRSLIMQKLDEIDEVSYVVPNGAFYIMVCLDKIMGKTTKDGRTVNGALDFANALLDGADVTVIPCEPFGAPTFVRLSYAISDADIVKGVERMGAFIKTLA